MGFDTGESADSVAPVDWFRFGAVAQRTRAYASELDVQRGLLAGFSFRKVDVTAHVFNWEWTEPIYLESIEPLHVGTAYDLVVVAVLVLERHDAGAVIDCLDRERFGDDVGDSDRLLGQRHRRRINSAAIEEPTREEIGRGRRSGGSVHVVQEAISPRFFS